MMFADGSLADDLCIGPAETAKVNCHGDAGQSGCGRRSTTFADRNLVRDAELERNHLSAGRLEDLAIRVENQMVFNVSADFFVATGSDDGKLVAGIGYDFDIEIH